MKLAIVILNWNGRKMMERFLPSVLLHSRNEATTIVADNASTDDSVEWLGKNHPEVGTILLDKNYGFAGGYNKALEQVEAEYYLLLNSDVEVTEHWLTPLIQYMDSHPECAACQPKLLSEADKGSFEYAGASGGFIDRFGYPFCRGRLFDSVERDEGQYDDTAEIFWATGACLMIRKDDFRKVGGFDERFFAHNEEIDLCWRIRLTGRKIVCIPQSHVFHVGGGTLPKGNPRKTFLNFRNNLTMLYKNVDDAHLKGVMAMRCLLDYVAALQTLVCNRNVGDFKAILKARAAFAEWKHSFDEDRRRIQAARKVKNPTGLYRKSILWQYYVKGHHKFSQLPKDR